MIKYWLTAASLKFFSATSQTRRLYRLLGNTVGSRSRRRQGLTAEYAGRVGTFLDFCAKYHPLRPGDQLLEVGTGWMHWESTILRLFHDVRITLFDVWDNRQFDAYIAICRQLPPVIDGLTQLPEARRQKAQQTLQEILRTRSFDELYELLGFRYLLNSAGLPEELDDNSFDMVFSWNVLEHVHRSVLPQLLSKCCRVLRPGGHSIHKIDLSDHLSHYDPSMSMKNYLRYSDQTWRRFFENDVQYFNRVQPLEWSQLFREAGFEQILEEPVTEDVGSPKLSSDFVDLSDEDRDCVWLHMVHRNPVKQFTGGIVFEGLPATGFVGSLNSSV